MTAGALLAAVERAAFAAFPDRAEKLIGVVERRLWFGPSASTEKPPESEHDVEASSRFEEGCAICARSRVNWSDAVMGIGGRFDRYDHDRSWEVRSESGHLRLPLTICGPCRILGGESPESDELALSDLVRALRTTGLEAESVVLELEQRFADSELPEQSHSPCLSCGAESRLPDSNRGGLCAACWRSARTVKT